MDKYKDKINIIDFIRGICIFLMLYGHCIQNASLGHINYFDNIIFRFIYSFHMPLFMIISGWCFYYSVCKRDLVSLLIHRIKNLIVPIVFVGGVGLIFIKILPYLILYGNINISIQDIKECLNLFWFLWSVIACSIPVAIAYKITNNRFVRIAILCFGVFLAYIFPNKVQNIFMYPYFICGFLLSKYNNNSFFVKYKKVISIISIIVFVVMLLNFKNDYYIYTTGIFNKDNFFQQLIINSYRYVIGFVGSFSVCCVLEIIYKKCTDNNRLIWLVQKICYLGSNSIKFYTLSVIFLSYYLPFIANYISGYFDYSILTSNVIVYEIVMFFLAIIYCKLIKLLIKILNISKINKLLYCR